MAQGDDAQGQGALLKLLMPILAARMAGGGGGQSGVGGLNAVPSDPGLGEGQAPAGQGGEAQLPFSSPAAPRTDPFFAPSGPNINFFGGSPFPAQDKTRQLLAGLVLGSRVLEVTKAARDAKRKADKAKASAGGQ